MKVQSTEVVHFFENINDKLYSISTELLSFSLERYKNVLLSNTDNFFDQLPVSEEEREYYYPYYFWWMVFCARGIIPKNKTIYQVFLQEYQWKYKKKPHLESSLLKWQYIFPSFYVIHEIVSPSIFCLFDIFDNHKYKVVITPRHPFKRPAEKDILAGIVLPLPDGGYFSVTDLLIIPDKIKTPLISNIIRNYQMDSAISSAEFFSTKHPEILKSTIEHLLVETRGNFENADKVPILKNNDRFSTRYRK